MEDYFEPELSSIEEEDVNEEEEDELEEDELEYYEELVNVEEIIEKSNFMNNKLDPSNFLDENDGENEIEDCCTNKLNNLDQSNDPNGLSCNNSNRNIIINSDDVSIMNWEPTNGTDGTGSDEGKEKAKQINSEFCYDVEDADDSIFAEDETNIVELDVENVENANAVEDNPKVCDLVLKLSTNIIDNDLNIVEETSNFAEKDPNIFQNDEIFGVEIDIVEDHPSIAVKDNLGLVEVNGNIDECHTNVENVHNRQHITCKGDGSFVELNTGSLENDVKTAEGDGSLVEEIIIAVEDVENGIDLVESDLELVDFSIMGDDDVFVSSDNENDDELTGNHISKNVDLEGSFSVDVDNTQNEECNRQQQQQQHMGLPRKRKISAEISKRVFISFIIIFFK